MSEWPSWGEIETALRTGGCSDTFIDQAAHRYKIGTEGQDKWRGWSILMEIINQAAPAPEVVNMISSVTRSRDADFIEFVMKEHGRNIDQRDFYSAAMLVKQRINLRGCPRDAREVHRFSAEVGPLLSKFAEEQSSDRRRSLEVANMHKKAKIAGTIAFFCGAVLIFGLWEWQKSIPNPVGDIVAYMIWLVAFFYPISWGWWVQQARRFLR